MIKMIILNLLISRHSCLLIYVIFLELYANVLCHILNLFFTGLLKDKICILDFLIDLIANKVFIFIISNIHCAW